MTQEPFKNEPASTTPEGSPEKDVWFCVPVHNNACTIARVIADCRQHLPHVVVVDDGSTDADLRQLLADQDVTVLRHETNRGKGAALLTGFEYIRSQGGKYAITLDGDGQHDPQDVTGFLPRLAHDTLILGRRATVRGHMPNASLLGRELSDFCIEMESGVRVRDSQSGFRAYPLLAVANLPLRSQYYTFEVEVIVRCVQAGLKIEDVPISVWYPPREERVTSFRKWTDNFRFVCLHLRLIARQLLPLPYSRLPADFQSAVASGPMRSSWASRNASPVGLALACGLALLLSMVHGLLGIAITAYIFWRWHWNLLATLAGLLVGYALHEQHGWWMSLAGQFMDVQEHPDLGWFVGTRLAALPLASAVGVLVYKWARRQQPLAASVRSSS